MKAFTFADVRNGTRFDRGHFEWLVENRFFAALGGNRYEVTAMGKDAADLGFYEV